MLHKDAFKFHPDNVWSFVEVNIWLLHCSYALASQDGHFVCCLFEDAFHRLHYILEDHLEMWTITVGCVFSLLTSAQHHSLVFVRGETQRRDAGCCCPVSSITERLTRRERKRGVGGQTRCLLSYSCFTDTHMDFNDSTLWVLWTGGGGDQTTDPLWLFFSVFFFSDRMNETLPKATQCITIRNSSLHLQKASQWAAFILP